MATSTTELTPPKINRKRGHNSDSEESSGSSESQKYDIRSTSESSESQKSDQRSSSGSPINLMNVPVKTSEWHAIDICNELQIHLRLEEDLRSLFVIGYHRFLGKNVQAKDFMRNHFETPDKEYIAKDICLQFALNKWKDVIDKEVIHDVSGVDAFKMNQELQKLFIETDFHECLNKEIEKIDGSLAFENEKVERKRLLQDTFQKIFSKMKLFSDQLLCVVNHKNCASERMLQDLFISFVRIFDLTIFDTTNSPNTCYQFHHGKHVVVSEPDAVILRNKLTPEMEIESKAVAVVEVKKDYSRDKEDEPLDKKIKLRTVTKDMMPEPAKHIDPKLKGQHIGEMLAVAESSSLFGQNGIFGFIVQGTKVTLVSLETKKEYFEYLKTKDKTKQLTAEVTYSKEYSFLSKDGRKDLIPILLGMEKLQSLNI